IDPNWSGLSEAEANQFLILSGFKDISIESNVGIKIYTGKYEHIKKYYSLYRSLLFRDNQCIAYTDEVVMVRECGECMTNKLYAPDGLAQRLKKTSTENDKNLKQQFIDEIKKSFRKDGIDDIMFISNTENNFEIQKEISTQAEKIKRHASLEQITHLNAYRLRVSKSVSKNIN
ncbi:hypothetical protein N9W02_03670, partial [Flavobacteriaceae bacterium]|nr:hypothetical protein [Flavobacteriaceae bacterium]